MKKNKAFLKELYRTMLRIRLCEESFVDPILTGAVHCPVHLYSGEEAIAAGVCAALSGSDYIFGTHRSHGHFLAKGCSMDELVAEVFGRETGCSKGRGGSMHLIDPEKGMLGAVPIVAGTISLAMGAALASSIRKDDRVTVSFFGDGATGEGVLYESLNFASLKKLPLIFVCENNLYSTHLPIDEIRVNRDIYKIAAPFGIRARRIDGNDVLAVYDAARDAVSRCRRGKGPVFLECLTYRFRGHVGPDDNLQGSHIDIRPKAEVLRWLRKDPLKKYEAYLTKNKVISKSELNEIYGAVKKEVEDAHVFAQNSAHPDRKDLQEHVFSG